MPKAAGFVSSSPFKFDEFVLDCDRYELHRGADNIKLEKIPMELLILLVSKDGKLVTRQEIIDHLWGKEVFVDTEHGINTAIRKIRHALKDDPEQPRFVQTVTGKGYRFIAECTNGSVFPGASPQPVPMSNLQSKGQEIPRHSMRWAALAVGGICVLAGAALVFNFAGLRDRIFTQNQIGPIHYIAVLPLTNLSGDPSQDYFADGMTDEMITALAENHSLRVVSRTSAMQFKGVNKPLREIARTLGVDGILEGSVVRTEDHVHVNLQLIYAPTDTHVWAESYDRSLSDAISLPEEVSETIATQAKTRPPAIKAQRYVDPEAHDAYLQGRFYWFMNDFGRSTQYFEQAAKLQPDYAAAWDGLADIYAASAVGWKIPPSKGFAQADEYANKALALDDSLPEVHNTLAAIYLFRDWNWQRAEAESRKAIALNPNFAEAYHVFSYALFVQNRDAEALQAQKVCTDLDPLARPWALGLAYLFAGQPDAAIADLKERAQFRRDFSTQINLAAAYQIKGQDREAAEAMRQAYLNINDAKAAAELAFKKRGMPGVWEWSVNQQLELAKKQYVSPWVLAYQYAELGDKEHTLAELDAAYKEHTGWLVFLQKEPMFNFLHKEPRYRTFVKNIGLQPAY